MQGVREETVTIDRVHVSIQETGKRKRGWKQWILRYDGALPDGLIWVPKAMDSDAFLDFCRDLASQGSLVDE